MSKKLIIAGLTLFVATLVITITCFAFTILTKEQALKEVFWSGAQIESETKELTGDVLARGWAAVWFMSSRVRNQPK